MDPDVVVVVVGNATIEGELDEKEILQLMKYCHWGGKIRIS